MRNDLSRGGRLACSRSSTGNHRAIERLRSLTKLLSGALMLAVLSGSSGCVSLLELENVTSQAANELAGSIPHHHSTRIAVFDLTSYGRPNRLGQRAASLLADHLNNKLGAGAILDRTYVAQQMQEHSFPYSNLDSDENTIMFGRKTRATVVVAGSIDAYRTYFDMRVRAIDLATGRVLVVSNKQFIRSGTNDKQFNEPPDVPPPAKRPLPTVQYQLRQVVPQVAEDILDAIRDKNMIGLRMAVGELRGPAAGGESAYGQLFMSLLQNELQQRGDKVKLRILERKQLRDALAAQRIEQTPFFNRDTVQDADASEGAEVLLYGTLLRSANKVVVTIKMMSMETKAVFFSADETIDPAEGQDELLQPS